MPSASWYISRLGRMSAAEIGFRIGRLLQGKWQAVAWRPGRASRWPSPAAKVENWLRRHNVVFDDSVVEIADNVLDGRLRLLGFDDRQTGWPPAWNTDPKTGIDSPSVFGKRIDYRDESLVGDIKYVWELNRHLEFPVLAEAFRRTTDERYLAALVDGWTSWLSQCRFPLGPNWCSSLESAIRLINWSIAWQILVDADINPGEDQRYREFSSGVMLSVSQHVRFIESYYSRHSSANNHLIGEAAGILVACKTWPTLSNSRKRAARAWRILGAEIPRQISSDGVLREQTVGYTPFVLEFVLFALAASEDTYKELSTTARERISRAFLFVDAITDSGGHFANFGDNDDGAAVRIWGFDFQDRMTGLGGLAERMGITAAEPPGSEPQFPDGGYLVLKCDEPEIHCVVDCGALGYLSTAAHGHADALSLVLSVAGHRFLIDPGTFAYHTDADWRNYFRSTAAHNTVRIDERDQSTIAGSFMWSHAASATIIDVAKSDDATKLCGAHDGYTRLSDPVIHTRTVELEHSTGVVRVTDEISCRQQHVVELHWHSAPECDLHLSGQNEFQLQNQSHMLTVQTRADFDLSTEVFSGSEAPVLGWCSDRFDQKVPANTVRLKGKCDGVARIVTEMRPG